jgi:hypothetical protein
LVREEGYLSLPHPGTLERLCRPLTARPGVDKVVPYLKLRLESLKDRPRAKRVILLADEIYVAGGVDYLGNSGELVGLTEDGKLAGTVLVFFICSIGDQ